MAEHDGKRGTSAPPTDGATPARRRVAGPHGDRLAGIAATLNGAPVQRAANETGMPDQLKSGVEALSGMSLDHVRVHRNSDKPAQLNAHAYAQGSDIHLAPGQEQHLPHEAWHVVQQAQGRVRPTMQMKAGVPINDDGGLEAEADRMGALAASAGAAPSTSAVAPATAQRSAVIQRMVWRADEKLEWQPTSNDPQAKKPNFPPSLAGTLYDDQTGQFRFPFNALPFPKMDEDDEKDEDFSPGSEMDDERDEDDELMNEQSEDDDDQMSPLTLIPSSAPLTKQQKHDMLDEAREKPISSSIIGHKPTGNISTFSTQKTFNSKVRKQSSGPVSIDLEEVEIYEGKEKKKRERPVRVEGIVEPTTTTGRKGAPDPKSGVQIYSGQKGLLSHSIQAPRNDGIEDSERGHIMALELGGPDVPENIVPQWGKFQGVGHWRRVEKDVLQRAKALKKGQKLRYTVEVHYKPSGEITPTVKTFGFPTGFTTTAITLDQNDQEIHREILFDQGQSQDQTDDKMSERQLYLLDEDALDEDTLLNSKSTLEKQKTKKK